MLICSHLFAQKGLPKNVLFHNTFSFNFLGHPVHPARYDPKTTCQRKQDKTRKTLPKSHASLIEREHKVYRCF